MPEAPSPPRCQYCGEAISGRVVECPACRTPHCADCWKANGGKCTTYGCRSTAPSTGRAKAPRPAAGPTPARRRPTPWFAVAAAGLIGIVALAASLSGPGVRTGWGIPHTYPPHSGFPSTPEWNAWEEAQDALDRNPHHPAAWIARGDAHLTLAGDSRSAPDLWFSAQMDYGEAIRLDPSNARAHMKRAMVRILLWSHDASLSSRGAAREDLDRAIQLEPTLAEAWWRRGLLRYTEGDRTGAKADFAKALQLDPASLPHFQAQWKEE